MRPITSQVIAVWKFNARASPCSTWWSKPDWPALLALDQPWRLSGRQRLTLDGLGSTLAALRREVVEDLRSGPPPLVGVRRIARSECRECGEVRLLHGPRRATTGLFDAEWRPGPGRSEGPARTARSAARSRSEATRRPDGGRAPRSGA